MRIELDDQESPEIQMAPLIDCVFLLLIFFLVATTLKKLEKELPLELPDSAAAALSRGAEDLLVVGVDEKGRLYLGSERISQALLHEKLRRTAKREPDRRIRVDVDRRTPFQDVVAVLDLCAFEGLNNVGLHTRSERAPR